MTSWLPFMLAAEAAAAPRGRFLGAVHTRPAAGATELLLSRARAAPPGGTVLVAVPFMNFAHVRRRLEAVTRPGPPPVCVSGFCGLGALRETLLPPGTVVLCTDRNYMAAARALREAPALFLFDDADTTPRGGLARGLPDPGAAVSWVVSRSAGFRPRLRRGPAHPACRIRLSAGLPGGRVRVERARDMRWRTPGGTRELVRVAQARLAAGEEVEAALEGLPFAAPPAAGAAPRGDLTCPVCLEEVAAGRPRLVPLCCGKAFCATCALRLLGEQAPGRAGFPHCAWCRAPDMRPEGVALGRGEGAGAAPPPPPRLELEHAIQRELREARRAVLVVDDADEGFLYNCVPPGMRCIPLRGNGEQVERALREFGSGDGAAVLAIRASVTGGCGLRLPEHSRVVLAARGADPALWGSRGPRGGAAVTVVVSG